MTASAAAATRRRVLLLAGTAQARALAARLAAAPDVDALASLSGATATPAPYAIPVRKGGFGGAGGLRAFLSGGGFDAVIDATHPFATRIGAAAAEACAALGAPLLRLERPPWRPQTGDLWTEAADAAAAAMAAPAGAVVFLAAGPGALAPFAARTDLRVSVRVIDAPPADLPAHVAPILGRPPFRTGDEVAALRAVGATQLVCKNSGGAAGRAKLEAARILALPVLMIARPPRPAGVETVADAEAALAWLARLGPPPRPGRTGAHRPSHGA